MLESVFYFNFRFVYGLHPFEVVFVKTVWEEESAEETGEELQQVLLPTTLTKIIFYQHTWKSMTG